MPIVKTTIKFEKPEDLDKVNFFTAGDFVGNNAGKISTRSVDHCVRVTAQPFMFDSASFGGVLDHVKVLYLRQPQSVGLDEIFEAKIRLGGQINQPKILPPFVCDKNDPRLGSVAMVVISNDFLVLDFIITNDKIYALYERLPFGWGSGPYSAFTSVHFLKKRKPTDFHDLKIVINKKTKKVEWTADDSSVSIERYGLQPGKSYNGQTFNNNFHKVLVLTPPGPVSIETDSPQLDSIQVGFGLFTLMDMGEFQKKHHGHDDSKHHGHCDPINNQCPSPLQGYLQLTGSPYAFPIDWVYDFTLPFTGTAKFSNDPNVQTTYGQSGYVDICKLKLRVDRN